MTHLHIDSGILWVRAALRELTESTGRASPQAHPDGNIGYRNPTALAGHHTPAAIETRRFGKPPVTEAYGELAPGEQLISELLAADSVLIGAPMYGFAIPSRL